MAKKIKGNNYRRYIRSWVVKKDKVYGAKLHPAYSYECPVCGLEDFLRERKCEIVCSKCKNKLLLY